MSAEDATDPGAGRTPRERPVTLEEALDGELPAETIARMQAHAEGCPECLEEWERVRRLKELVRRSCADRAPSGLRERITVQYRTVSVTRTDAEGRTSVHVTTTSTRTERPAP